MARTQAMDLIMLHGLTDQGFSPPEHRIILMPEPGVATAIVDLDQDNISDYITVGPRQIMWSRGPSSGSPADGETWTMTGGDQIIPADFDGDGIRDILLLADSALQLIPGARDQAKDPPFELLSPVHGVTSADLNGDGSPEILALSRDASLQEYLQIGQADQNKKFSFVRYPIPRRETTVLAPTNTDHAVVITDDHGMTLVGHRT